MLRPAKKHRFKFQRLPINYETDAFPVQREFVFNGQRYTRRPAGDDVAWTSRRYSFGYEYDFLYFPRGFVGAQHQHEADQHRRRPAEPDRRRSSSQQSAPIPAFGFAGRGYITPNLAVDGEFTFFRIPESLEEQLEGDGSYNDFDIHAHLQLQQVRRRAARLAQDDDLLRGRARYAAT